MSTLKEGVNITGSLVIEKTEPSGNTTTISIPNLVVTTGKVYIASRVAGNAAAVMSHMAVGTGNTAAAVGDTGLVAELARVALSVPGGSPTSNTVVYSATYPAGTGTGTLTEAGIFNLSSAGTMLCRTVFPAVTKANADTIAISWTVSVG